MLKVNTVEKSRKDYPEDGIIKGEKYYWWEFRNGGKHRSKAYPKPYQLTQSSFLQSFLQLTEKVDNLSLSDFGELDDIDSSSIESVIEEYISELNEMKDELEGNRDNLPEQFQEAGPGEILTNRIDALEAIIGDLESVDADFSSEIGGKPIDPNSEEAKKNEKKDTEKNEEDEEDTRTYEEKLEEYNSTKEEKIEEIIGAIQEAFSNNSVD